MRNFSYQIEWVEGRRLRWDISTLYIRFQYIVNVRNCFLVFLGLFVRNTCSVLAFYLKFKWNSKTDSFLLIKTWELKIDLAYSLLHYDIIALLNCKTDLIFIADSQRSHYNQSSIIFWAVCVKIVSLNIAIGLKSYT